MFLQNFYRLSILFLGLAILFNAVSKPLQSNVDTLFTGSARSPRILLLTAHPDDECLFFAPTLTVLLSQAIGHDTNKIPQVYSLCLSVGDADGLGDVRKEELGRSLNVLGVEEGKRWILDQPDLKDNITVYWSAESIANALRPFVIENDITTILTFDYEGISSHPNHQSLPHGVVHLINSLAKDSIQHSPRVFALITVPLIHKYVGPLSAALAKTDVAFTALLQQFGNMPSNPIGAARVPVFVAGISEYRTALRAMLQHGSQLVWFRWLYVAFSRYMWVNEWLEIVPVTHTAAAGIPSPAFSI
ncbi:hypothetical protein EW026_g4816 [Hermanssonia centrifuga]|uniref:N-acetylglucosaminylphosphatidylinositol deacetylase n=1 Tax=Hermanssonia centrifuga TaxID=98765 RepID=A0A4S4KHS7_9APHY|nr:hypothetical protein EW026_g4816 [Hermanssonia centrifuga]